MARRQGNKLRQPRRVQKYVFTLGEPRGWERALQATNLATSTTVVVAKAQERASGSSRRFDVYEVRLVVRCQSGRQSRSARNRKSVYVN